MARGSSCSVLPPRRKTAARPRLTLSRGWPRSLSLWSVCPVENSQGWQVVHSFKDGIPDKHPVTG